MGSPSRQVFLWSTWAFVASVVLQVFFIGLYLFAGYDIGLHFLGALIVTIVSLVVLGMAFVARADGRTKRWAGALFVLTIIQGSLPGLKGSLPLASALHPVGALVLFGVGLLLVRDAKELARMPLATSEAGSAPAESPSA
jgi:hypothetical protein